MDIKQDWETLSKSQQIKVWGQLCAMKDIKDHIEVLQECYTRLLVKNGIQDEEVFNESNMKSMCEEIDKINITEEKTTQTSPTESIGSSKSV
jgi:hypothetical protein